MRGIIVFGQDHEVDNVRLNQILFCDTEDFTNESPVLVGQGSPSFTPKPYTQLRADISLPESSSELLPKKQFSVPGAAVIAAPKTRLAVYEWESLRLMREPLYFEQPKLERFGYTRNAKLQPFRSGAKFFADVVVWPIKLWRLPPHVLIGGSEFESSMGVTDGFYRPAFHSGEPSIPEEQLDESAPVCEDPSVWEKRFGESVPAGEVPTSFQFDDDDSDFSLPTTSQPPGNLSEPDRSIPEFPLLPPLPSGDS